ncbi:MAG: VWA domain-containing protein [Candidatus Lokiarchaeota archaeon]|nr:VWA domain-containing protein [Candidatus Lokiarchaeota archaeon]MBD3341855.1 VWA domain-containing protein [Candidatus Lokiarchaeota archaeon]
MFVEFFYYLKKRLPVSITEYMTLMQALNEGLIHNMVEFYYISRSILCKNEHHFDVYDIAFANFFKDAMLKFPEDIKQEIWDWLEKDFEPEELPDGFQEFLNFEFDIEEMQKQFEELMKKQDDEHNFGNQWIGTQGISQFGHSGQNPMGMRVGGTSGMRMAIQIAQKRIFQDYRKDVVLDTRQIKVALKRLRKLEEIGRQDELNIDKTIDKTAKNGGDIELFFEKRRKNNVKLILLMDVGGSMTPYAHLVNLLFSAANNMSHWKDFKYYYFHNCVYEQLFFNAQRNPDEAIEFDDFLRKFDNKYKVVMVGDAAMASYELTERYGSIYYYHRNEMPGIYYIREIANHFKNNVVWLNPELIKEQWQPWTRKIISSIVPMFNLTVEGIEEAMNYLRRGGRNIYTTVQKLKGFTY